MSSPNQYCNIEKYGEIGRIDKTIQGVRTCRKARQVFYAYCKKEGIDYRAELGISPKDIKAIIPKKFMKGTIDPRELDPRIMGLKELEYYHAFAHSKIKKLFSPWCGAHFKIVEEMDHRNLIHLTRTLCDRIIELIRDWKTYNPKNISDAVLRDDWRIVNAWIRMLRTTKKKFTSSQFKDYSLQEQIKIVKNLGKKIKNEMNRRGWKPEAKLAFKLPKGMTIEDIDPVFAEGKTNRELIEIWKFLVREAEEDRITEPIENAGIHIGIQMKKRGIWEDNHGDNKLYNAVKLEVVEYSEDKEPEGSMITMEQIYNATPELIVIPGQPYAGYYSGRRVNEESAPKSHDQDLILRQKPDPRVLVALKRANPKWWSNLIHPTFDEKGPLIGHSRPIFRYGLVKIPKREYIKGFGPYRNKKEELAGVKPFQRIRALKAKSGWGKNEFWKYNNFYKTWASKYLDRGIIIQKKYDGRRFLIHKRGDKIRIITEDQMRDRSNVMPNVVKELKGIKHDFILDSEMVAYDCKGKQVKGARSKESICDQYPREDTAWATVGNISSEQESSMAFHIHDILYFDGKSLNNIGYQERIKYIMEVVPKNSRYLSEVLGLQAKTPGALTSVVNKLRTVKGSEGIMAKVADSIYPIRSTGENRTPEWAKLKNLKSIDVMVWSATPKRKVTGEIIKTYMYDSYILIPQSEVKHWRKTDVIQWKGKYYCRIGKTYGRKLVPKRGDIIEVLVGRIREYVKNGVHWITWMFPNFRELRPEKKEPDTLDTARKLAKVGPGFIERLFEKVVTIDLELCPYKKDKSVCPLRKRFSMPRAHLLTRLKIQKLKYPVACPIASLFRCYYIKAYYYGYDIYKRRE